MNPQNTASKVLDKVSMGYQDACWSVEGSGNGKGYRQVQWDGRLRYAHRVTYEILRGPIPAGLTLDHLCRNRGCCNPWHTEPVPNRVNVLRGQGHTARNARRTHCTHGHPFDEANTRHGRNGWRV